MTEETAGTPGLFPLGYKSPDPEKEVSRSEQAIALYGRWATLKEDDGVEVYSSIAVEAMALLDRAETELFRSNEALGQLEREVAALTAERDEPAKHWHDLYRKECLLRQDDAARYGEKIQAAEAELDAAKRALAERDTAFRLDGYHPVTTHVIAECPHCHAHATLPITRDEWIKGTPVHLAALAAKSTEEGK